jgi:hypothetical protein
MDLKNEWGGVNCIYLAHGRKKWRTAVNTAVNGSSFIKCREYFDQLRHFYKCSRVLLLVHS